MRHKAKGADADDAWPAVHELQAQLSRMMHEEQAQLMHMTLSRPVMRHTAN